MTERVAMHAVHKWEGAHLLACCSSARCLPMSSPRESRSDVWLSVMRRAEPSSCAIVGHVCAVSVACTQDSALWPQLETHTMDHQVPASVSRYSLRGAVWAMENQCWSRAGPCEGAWGRAQRSVAAKHAASMMADLQHATV